MGLIPDRVKPKIIKLMFGASPAKQAALKSKNKDWLALNKDNVSEWSDMSTHGLLFLWADTTIIQCNMLV
jgi:hypothetical protein